MTVRAIGANDAGSRRGRARPSVPDGAEPQKRADFRACVVTTVAQLLPGEVCSYGDIAADAGFPGAARAVGSVLASSHGLPWWRVVYADGRLAPGHEAEQAERLAAEGVDLEGGRVRMPARR